MWPKLTCNWVNSAAAGMHQVVPRTLCTGSYGVQVPLKLGGIAILDGKMFWASPSKHKGPYTVYSLIITIFKQITSRKVIDSECNSQCKIPLLILVGFVIQHLIRALLEFVETYT